MAAAPLTPLQRRLGELRLRFIDRARQDHGRIQGALAAGDLALVHQLAHRLHGIAGTFGFTAVTTAAAELETAIEEASDVPHRTDRLLKELEAIAAPDQVA